MTIRRMTPADAPRAAELMRVSRELGEVLWKPMTAEEISARLFAEGTAAFAAADAEGVLQGFAHGGGKALLLNGETAENTPYFLTMLLVARESRGQGAGTALLEAVKAEARRTGRSRVVISGDGPLPLTWIIPGTPGHDHNNMPGADTSSPAFDWLKKRGFVELLREISLYMDLKTYRQDPRIGEMEKKLSAENIRVGRWAPELGDDFDGMCDRVGSEYWRHVLQEETRAWKEGRPNGSPDLWPDGRKPAGPRPLLTATHDGKIIGFTGPVDLQKSGRGWFTGICTDPEWSGHGIASVLFDTLMREFIAEGAAFSSIFTGLHNSAQRIYFREGFSQRAEFAVMSLPLAGEADDGHKYF